jgi:hypothetical protein
VAFIRLGDMLLGGAKGYRKESGSVGVWCTSTAPFDSKIRSMGRVFHA